MKTPEETQRAELHLRRRIEKTKAEVEQFFFGDFEVLGRAQNDAFDWVMSAVNCGDISWPVAEGLKMQIQDWSF